MTILQSLRNDRNAIISNHTGFFQNAIMNCVHLFGYTQMIIPDGVYLPLVNVFSIPLGSCT